MALQKEEMAISEALNMLKDYFIFSINGLRSRRLRSWLTMLGIFIGIAAVVGLIGLGEGLRTAINAQFGFLDADILSITASGGFGPPGTGVIDPLTDKELKAIRSTPGITGAVGRVMVAGKLVFNNKAGFGMGVSIPDGEDRELLYDIIGIEAEQGRLLRDGDKNLLVLGNNFLKDDNGFDKAITPGKKVELEDEEFEVVGIMEKKGSFLLDSIVLINEDVLRDLFDRADGEYDVIGAKFDKNADVPKIKASIDGDLRKIRDVKVGEENFNVETPEATLETLNSTLLAVQIFVYIIAGISLLVGGIGIMNTMYTTVVERTKEIGIMKSIGATNNAIFLLFFIESGLLGSVGGIIGVILGFTGAKTLAYVGSIALGSDFISAEISFSLIIGALIFSFLIGSIFGSLPAIRASKLNPVDALRYVK